MSKFLTFSSITKKITLSIVGLFLVVFLIVHLCINLTLLCNDNGEIFNKAAHFMGTNIFIKIFEVVLFAAFILHVVLGVILQIQNWIARPIGYKVAQKTKTSFFSRYMIYTGIVIAIFLVIHFMNFYFIKFGIVEHLVAPLEGGEPNFYETARVLFGNSIYSIIYIVLLVVLGIHLNHAFQSAFQTLGLANNKYTPCIKTVGTIYSIVIALGFIIIPIYFLVTKI
ncbi:MAG: succinate dehydrogenase cytochrome b subunit [Saprospiraceae bacterium]|nr:succinate dehydrogenase cytochrome b subunit [Saprospiraceae bacterium]